MIPLMNKSNLDVYVDDEYVEDDYDYSEYILPIHPDRDGIDFINIWFKGKTELGQMLSHFYNSPFEHPYFGPFNSMEGFWHFIQTIEKDNELSVPIHYNKLRSLSGMAAKNYGKSLTWHKVDQFYEIIEAANYYKIEQNTKLYNMFVSSKLPFEMYFIKKSSGDADGQGEIVIKLENYRWLLNSFEKIRIMMQYDERPKIIDYKAIFD